MMDIFRLFLFLLLMEGVLHEKTHEQKTVDETVLLMEGQSVTLESGVTEIQTDMIVWTYGNTRIAQMNIEPGRISLYDGDGEMFRGKLQLNNQNGSLTIRNIRTKHSGLYYLQNLSSGVLSKRFMVTVSAHLPVPVITRESSSSSTCVLLCSVMNVTHVTLSWYKGNSLFSSISVSDLNIRLSLPLEVEYQDTNTYSCVLNNPITNQTQHLNIPDVCQPCSGVFGDPGEVKTVSVMEGDSLTLHTDLTHIQSHYELEWRFGADGPCIAIKRSMQNNPVYENIDERFRDRLEMNNQTGDLTITNIRSEHTGLYTLDIIIGIKQTIKSFNVIVYAPSSTVSGQL